MSDEVKEKNDAEMTSKKAVVLETGRKLPFTAIGDLTVENSKDIAIVDDEKPKIIEKAPVQKKKEITLPPVGEKFMVNGQTYKVCYVNAGKKRFSAEPCDGMY